MPPITPDSLTLITGANGFIAAHCISTLLHAGYNVRSTVRSAAKAQAALQALSAANVPSLQSHLELVVVPDPTVLEDVSRAVRGCGAILHLASAFSYDASPGEFEEKLMKPAVRGTETICRAALEHDSVKRVVIMSSFASVYDASLGLQPGRVYTETDWCPLSYEDGVNAAAVVGCLPSSISLTASVLIVTPSLSPIVHPKSSLNAQRGISSATIKSDTICSRSALEWCSGR